MEYLRKGITNELRGTITLSLRSKVIRKQNLAICLFSIELEAFKDQLCAKAVMRDLLMAFSESSIGRMFFFHISEKTKGNLARLLDNVTFSNNNSSEWVL